MDSGADSIIAMKDAQTKAMIANLETKRVADGRLRDIKTGAENAGIRTRMRNELLFGIGLLMAIALLTFVFFFIVL